MVIASKSQPQKQQRPLNREALVVFSVCVTGAKGETRTLTPRGAGT